jgi:hypothetical protein
MACKARDEGSFAAPPGYVAQPWIEEPTRAGWWWWLDKGTGLIELLRVKNFGTDCDPHLCAYADEKWGGYTIAMMREYKPGWWSGPVEPPEPPTEAPPHSDAT